MKIPYGISDFVSIRKGNYLYIDKTKYVKQLEEIGNYIFFIRPRRFGKSLFLSLLENYYDINTRSEFDKLFSDLYIGANSTELQNSFLILKINFSGLNTSSKELLRNSFRKTILTSLTVFLEKYNYLFLCSIESIIEELKNENDLKRMMEIIFNIVYKTDKKIYLIIDEYDHFANDIIAIGDSEYYKDIVRARGFVRDFYETVKIGTERVIDRIFITGISPIMLDDLTSGFNITLNITMLEKVNDMLGFTQDEVNAILKEFYGNLEDKEIFSTLKSYYNGYLINEKAKNRIYNPNMVLYFFKQWQITGEYPEKLIDDNVKMDYGRLNRLISNKANQNTLELIIKEEKVVADIISKFSFDQMYDESYFVSLLFYLGLLTIDQKKRTRLFLKIPNFVIKTIFWETFAKKLQERYQLNLNLNELYEAIEMIAYDGKLEPYLDFVSKNILQVLSNRDLIQFDEKYLKIILISYLNFANIYSIESEREVEGGYIDILLEKDIRYPDVQYEWLLELKYIKKRDKDRLEQVKNEDLSQLERYSSSQKFIDRKNLKKALIIFVGKTEYEIITIN